MELGEQSGFLAPCLPCIWLVPVPCHSLTTWAVTTEEFRGFTVKSLPKTCGRPRGKPHLF